MSGDDPTRQLLRFDTRWLGEVLALAACYFLTARLGLLMAIPGAYVTPVWPPSGIALAAVLLRGRRVWPGILLGSFAANFWHFYGSRSGLPTELATAATIAIGASLTALLGRHLLRRFVGERNPLARVQDVCAFMALGGVVSCLASATIGVTALCLAGYSGWAGYGQAWVTLWLGDMGGVFIVAPLLLVWAGPHRRMAVRWMELVGGFGLMVAVTYYVFCKNTVVAFTGKALTFIILIPFLVWAALRTGRRGAAAAVGLIALLAVWGTIHQTGPFNLGTRNEALLLLEMFLAVLALTALCLAAMVTEREQVVAAQKRALEELESHVRERTSALVQSEKQAYQHLAEAERARAALLGILEDQQQGEEKLRESQARLQLLVKSSNIGLWDWNLITNEVFFSPEWKSQLGYADDEVPGRYEEWKSRLHPEDRESSLRAVNEFREGQRNNYDIEFRMRHKNGSWRSILTRADLIRDETGQPVRMMGCHVDITDRKQAAEKLERNEREQRQLAEELAMEKARLVAAQAVAKVGSWETDASTGTVTWSDETHRIFETQPATFDPTHQLFLELVHPEDRARVAEAFVRGLALRSPCAVEHRLLMPDGRVKHLEERWQTFFDREGKPIRAVGTCQDITERKQAHEELRRVSRRLVDVQEQERRHLARELHDEIGQTLTAAKMNLESIELTQSSAHAPRLKETITLLDNLLRQIRQISLDLHPSLLDDLGLVPALRSLLDQRASKAGLRAHLFAREAMERVDIGIQTAAFRIAQEAITNVLRHANAQSIHLYLQNNGHQLRMKIVDDGIGFNPGRAGVKNVAGETGFGLLSMRERAALTGGLMQIVSAANKGTTIEVMLPLHAPDEKP